VAKPYLTFHDSTNHETLSVASKQTLKFQGVPITVQEAQGLERDKLFEPKVKMRNRDDEAKKLNRPVQSLDRYRLMCQDYLIRSFERVIVKLPHFRPAIAELIQPHPPASSD